MKLPSKKELPAYYALIKRPIDISKILNHIEEGKVNLYLLYPTVTRLTYRILTLK